MSEGEAEDALKQRAFLEFRPLLSAFNRLCDDISPECKNATSGWTFSAIDVGQSRVDVWGWLEVGDGETKGWRASIIRDAIFPRDSLFMLHHGRDPMLWQSSEQQDLIARLPGYFSLMRDLRA